jgi:3-hydroxyacyl-[acyl-carrier-protein] dehydratase
MRFFLIDRIREMVPGDRAIGVKCWSMDNEIFQDHFPGLPTTSGVLIKKSYYKEYGTATKVYPVLSIIQKAKFRSFVRPGDQCVIKAQLISIDRGRGNAKVETFVEDELVCEATLSFIIGMEMDMKNNPQIDKIDTYFDSISPKIGD